MSNKIGGLVQVLIEHQAPEPESRISMKEAEDLLQSFYEELAKSYDGSVQLDVGAGMAYARLQPESKEADVGDIDLDIVLKSAPDMMSLVMWVTAMSPVVLRPGVYLFQCGRISVHISTEVKFKTKGVRYWTKDELLALYKHLNRPKDQEKIKVLSNMK